MSQNLLLIGRWHGITQDQETGLRRSVEQAGPGRLVFVITGADQSGTKRHPLAVAERQAIIRETVKGWDREYEIHAVNDISDSARWVEHIRQSVHRSSAGATNLSPENTTVISANPDVVEWFRESGFPVHIADFTGAMPADLFAAIRAGTDWRGLANRGTLTVYGAHGLAERIHGIFADVLLTDDGELSSGRNFAVYIKGMDASMAVKVQDICPWVKPGTIVDKGCGSGTLLKHLSALYPESQILGVDLSRELLRVAESQHFPNHNVSVVKGNIIHQRFPAGSVCTAIFSSVIHEVYSYNGYDRDVVRLALKNTRTELQDTGRLIIRDGIMPVNEPVWMWCDAETEERFRRFAVEFKKGSPAPGVPFEEVVLDGTRWYLLDLHHANEFLSKKDYLENWDIEVKEEFGVFNLRQWERELHAQRYRVVHAAAYLNPWIASNRYQGRVRLHAHAGNQPGRVLQFPETTAVIVGEAA